MSARDRVAISPRRRCNPPYSGVCSTISSPNIVAAAATNSTATTPALPAASSSPSFSSQTTTSTLSASSSVDAKTSKSNAGTIVGSVIGGVVFILLVLLGLLLFLRARKRKRTPPSSEFMNSLRSGAPPVLRLDSGAEFSPALPEKGGGYMHYPPCPLPFQQNSYYTSPPMQDMKFPDELMMTDIPAQRPSIDKPLQPQRYSAPPPAKDASVKQHHLSSSVGSKLEPWGRDAGMISRTVSPARLSPAPRDSVLHFAPHLSLDSESPAHPQNPSRSPTPLQPLRRQPDPEDT